MAKNNEQNEIREYLRGKLNDYMSIVGNLTPEEKKDLRKWVADGNSVYDNPCLLYGEDGHPMDYITAIRIDADMYEDYINGTGKYVFGDLDAGIDSGDTPF